MDNRREFEPSLWPWWWRELPNLLYNTCGYNDAQPYQVSKPFVQHTWLWWYATIPSLQTRKVSRKLSALLLSLTRLVSQKRWPCTEQGIRTYTESLPAASLGEFPSTDSSFSLCVKQDADSDCTWSDSSSAGKKRKKKEGGSLQTKQNGTVKKRQCPQTTTLEEKGEAKQIRT